MSTLASTVEDVGPSLRLTAVNLDCSDAGAMAEFYGRLLGWEVYYRDVDFIAMREPSGGIGLSFQELKNYRPPVWPEKADSQDKMLHPDFKVDDLDGAVAHALASGARLSEFQGRDDLRVMLDPAGHPFCLCTV